MTAHLRPETQDLLRAYSTARERCEVNRQIAEWIIDLQARLERAQTPFWQTDYSVESPDELKAEVERLRLYIMLAARAREGGER
jgi:hypothetical protein